MAEYPHNQVSRWPNIWDFVFMYIARYRRGASIKQTLFYHIEKWSFCGAHSQNLQSDMPVYVFISMKRARLMQSDILWSIRDLDDWSFEFLIS